MTGSRTDESAIARNREVAAAKSTAAAAQQHRRADRHRPGADAGQEQVADDRKAPG
jgi:hypothetical protein